MHYEADFAVVEQQSCLMAVADDWAAFEGFLAVFADEHNHLLSTDLRDLKTRSDDKLSRTFLVSFFVELLERPQGQQKLFRDFLS